MCWRYNFMIIYVIMNHVDSTTFNQYLTSCNCVSGIRMYPASFGGWTWLAFPDQPQYLIEISGEMMSKSFVKAFFNSESDWICSFLGISYHGRYARGHLQGGWQVQLLGALGFNGTTSETQRMFKNLHWMDDI